MVFDSARAGSLSIQFRVRETTHDFPQRQAGEIGEGMEGFGRHVATAVVCADGHPLIKLRHHVHFQAAMQ